jgi:RsiW-degrading membrane proteinase PrsW (M82 family)
MNLLALALAPILIILLYVYVKDKYDKEPLPLLLKSLLLGALISIPVVFVEGALTSAWQGEFTIAHAGYTAFVVAGLTEELFKFIVLYWLIWKHKEFDEKYDGIVYAVFISLGFAAVENVLYVLEYGAETGYLRAFTAVPAHAFFGVVMGFYFALAVPLSLLFLIVFYIKKKSAI